MRTKTPERNSARVVRAAACIVLIAGQGLWASPGADAARAHTARSLSVTDNAHLSLVSADGNTLIEKGKATGTLPGTVEVSLTLGNRTATSSFTIRTKGGTISGHGKGTLKPGKGGYDSFGGSVTVAHGTGRFRGAHGEGALYGSLYRVTEAMGVQVTGKLHY